MSTPPQYSRKDEASLLSSDQSSTASAAEEDSPVIGEDSSSNASSDLPALPAVPPLVSNKAKAYISDHVPFAIAMNHVDTYLNNESLLSCPLDNEKLEPDKE
jgi:hypothetical protein